MSFPASYLLYQEVTIDHTKVSADLTDYVVYIDLANLVKAGADIFDTCRSDGGDIRATKSDGTTQLATELVAIDTTAKTGELHVKFTGTLSSSTDTIIRIWYNGTDTLPAATDTYGRNAVWSGYRAVYHLQGTTDSTGNGYNLSNPNGATFGAGKMTNGVYLDGSNDYLGYTAGDMGVSSGNQTLSIYVKMQAEISSSVKFFISKEEATTDVGLAVMYEYNGGTRRLNYIRAKRGITDHNSYYNVNLGTSNWHKLDITYDSATVLGYYNGSQVSSVSSAGNGSGGSSTEFGLGRLWNNYYFPYAILDEARVTTSTLSSTWISTEYNNQNSPSTFYSAGSEQGGGGGGYTPTPILHMLQMI